MAGGVVFCGSNCFRFRFSMVGSVRSGEFSVRLLQFHDPSQPFEIISHSLERQLQLVSGQSQVADSAVVLPLLEMRKDTLNVTANPCFASVIALIPGGELDVM